MRKFANGQVVPYAQEWHLRNEYIPLDIITQMSSLACSASPSPKIMAAWGSGRNPYASSPRTVARLYRGRPLGTRSEIAAELILGSGTEDQKRQWLPKIASGEVLPTAVFTEPNTGSDMASLKDAGSARGRRL